jgi:mannose-6-phosphate isomerase-like protein (cupin superfamily)
VSASSVWFLDTLVDVHLGPESTGGRYDLVEVLAPQGHRPPPHVHAAESEGFLVLEGELTVFSAEGERVLREGDAYDAPAGVPHTIAVTSDVPARFLTMTQPAGFAAFARAFGTPAARRELPVLDGPPDVERLVRVAGDHGITFVDSLDAA